VSGAAANAAVLVSQQVSANALMLNPVRFIMSLSVHQNRQKLKQ
jgi:hypothetical protein